MGINDIDLELKAEEVKGVDRHKHAQEYDRIYEETQQRNQQQLIAFKNKRSMYLRFGHLSDFINILAISCILYFVLYLLLIFRHFD